MNEKNAATFRKRSFLQKGKLHHHYHRRKGSYSFVGKNMLKLGLSIGLFGAALFLINQYLFDIDAWMADNLAHLNSYQIYGVFFLSESFLGLVPPDLFIIWSKTADEPWLVISLLSILSYGGGQVSFQLGRWINHIPSFHSWIHKKYEQSIIQFKKFGALVIILGALTPLPFSPISIISGSLEYPRRMYSLLALARILRFFLYGYFLFKL